jgi:hypothetical protein
MCQFKKLKCLVIVYEVGITKRCGRVLNSPVSYPGCPGSNLGPEVGNVDWGFSRFSVYRKKVKWNIYLNHLYITSKNVSKETYTSQGHILFTPFLVWRSGFEKQSVPPFNPHKPISVHFTGSSSKFMYFWITHIVDITSLNYVESSQSCTRYRAYSPSSCIRNENKVCNQYGVFK